jgi:hypothetical protein
MRKFNLNNYKKKVESGRKRIKDRGINWEEKYHERSKSLKKKFDKRLGPNAYHRWEGHDYTTNSDYFVVVGPAKQRDGKKSFFAGIKKLPEGWEDKKVYAPSGKYFSSISSALSHANEMWGVPYPGNQPNYSDKDLIPIEIPRHVKG